MTIKPKTWRIGEVAKKTGFSTDTLRYYEKIGLLPRIGRSANGLRYYSEKDLSRLGFIARSKTMGFSLEDIIILLALRDDPAQAQPQVRALTQSKHAQIVAQIKQLDSLRRELELLLNLCTCKDGQCGIIQQLEQ